MTSFVDISLVGDKQLQRKLKRLDLVVQKKIVRKAIREAWRPVLETAKAQVPYETGALHDTLKLRAIRPKRGFFGVQVRAPTREELGIPAEDKGYYPAILEFGTATRLAYPYLRPAFDQNTDRARAIFRREVVDGILRAVR